MGHERLEALSLARFGAVMISGDVYSGRRVVDYVFREESDRQKGVFSGWTFFSSQEAADATSDQRGLELHDCLAILRIAPEVAAYLDMPPGTVLVRTGEQTFEVDTDEDNAV